MIQWNIVYNTWFNGTLFIIHDSMNIVYNTWLNGTLFIIHDSMEHCL